MELKKSLSIAGALMALGVAGPAVAVANSGTNETSQVTTAPSSDYNQATADEQQSGEQGDVENTDLATQVEEADGANNESGVNEEAEVGDGSDGQVDDGPLGNG